MMVSGVMSGTSADGINVALVQIGGGSGTIARGRGNQPHVKLLGHAEYSYSKKVRATVLAAMNSPEATVADLARLNFLLGELYADAILAAQRQLQVKVSLVG